MIGQFKKVKRFSDVKTGDNIVLYSHQSPTSKIIRERYYHVTLKTNEEIECTRLNKEGKTFYNRWYESEDACPYVIEELKKTKQNINKKIFEYQKLMHTVKDEKTTEL